MRLFAVSLVGHDEYKTARPTYRGPGYHQGGHSSTPRAHVNSGSGITPRRRHSVVDWEEFPVIQPRAGNDGSVDCGGTLLVQHLCVRASVTFVYGNRRADHLPVFNAVKVYFPLLNPISVPTEMIS